MREYFCGWYFKCQSSKHSLAIIPAIHKSKKQRSCSIQFITNERAYNVCLPYDKFHKQKNTFCVHIDGNHFGADGIKLCINEPNFTANGTLKFGEFSRIKYDIMGPFKFVPFMECRHSVISMEHTVTGNLTINGVAYEFNNAEGYIEGDRGCSFPEKYAWTQCFFENGSLMLSVAEIPIGPLRFTGVIGVINLDEKEYRIATYLGAKVKENKNGQIVIEQGDMIFSARLIEKQGRPLFAPKMGKMSRTIHESLCSTAAYFFKKKGQALLDLKSSKASFEYEY